MLLLNTRSLRLKEESGTLKKWVARNRWNYYAETQRNQRTTMLVRNVGDDII